MKKHSVTIISNETAISEAIASKILLLRKSDKIGFISTERAQMELNDLQTEIILLFIKDESPLSYLQNIKSTRSFENTPIILVTETFDTGLIYDAFDIGINDFYTLDSDHNQLLLKVMMGMRDREKTKEIEKKNRILSKLKITDEESGFYTKTYSTQTLKVEIENIINSGKSGIFVALSVDLKHKNILPQSMLASIIKKSVRKEDICSFGQDNKFYIILPETNKEGCIQLINKIQENIKSTYKICAVATEIIDTDLESLESTTGKVLSTALINGNSFVYIDNCHSKKINGWIDKSDLKETNFRLFKQTFNKKFDKLVTPVFFQKQTILQNKLFEAKVEQYVDEAQSEFSIKSKDAECSLIIKYPGYAKINTNIKAKNRYREDLKHINLELNELSASKLEELLNQLVATYQEYDNE